MKTITLIPIIVMTFLSCNAQEKKEDLNKMNQPKESWNVNKKVDKNGNVTQYDSTYTWSYSNLNGDSITVNLDSVMQSFNDFFKDSSPYDWNDHLSFFPQDSLLMNSFFNDDYFFNNWEQQNFDMEQMMHQMDSIRNEYLKKFYPGLMESDPNKKENTITQ